ncbi:hypothetical protein [Desulfovibrio psychrotolerans]|uniref:Uncharacterized protein n=1 Tax=Desulfovibrio psychrotolerans TaxID=415242 RepID=A0A7J0BRF4_9BACT|nr:hypothetical protein [Desulfovibrio psychrotolerans]GFM35594.1 hypothetical protein DSM19430T_02780 [Desulfovibrio psychrotolerans]
MHEKKPFAATSTYLLCVIALTFLCVVWPFPTVLEAASPQVMYLYLFGMWGAGIAAIFVWAVVSARYESSRRGGGARQALHDDVDSGG